MNKTKIVRERFTCPILGSIANTETTYVVHASGLQAAIKKFDCEDCHNCGIGRLNDSGLTWSFDWDSCPKYSALRSKGTR